MGRTVIPKHIAQELRCDVKKVRRWLRRRYPSLVGKEVRWGFSEQEAKQLVNWIRERMKQESGHEPT
jgi:hypothetical protein